MAKVLVMRKVGCRERGHFHLDSVNFAKWYEINIGKGETGILDDAMTLLINLGLDMRAKSVK